MTYESVVALSQSASLLLFMALFFIVLGYVFWPNVNKELEQAQRAALDLDTQRTPGGRK